VNEAELAMDWKREIDLSVSLFLLWLVSLGLQLWFTFH
jgi:hypothetical protein